MQFNGFRSISEYEDECRSHGFVTKRIPFSRGGENFFVLMTSLAHPSPTSVSAWSLFPVDESKEILSGVDNGLRVNYLGKLESQGFYPVKIC